MEPQMLMNALFGIVLLGTGWFLNELWRAVKELRSDLHQLEADLPKEYITRHEWDKRMDHIEGMLQRIFDKLDGKADKP
jgi:CCR4-NOT transcriptional regulation complex NOT5 subunit